MAVYFPENWEDTGEFSSYEPRGGVDWDEVCQIEEEEHDVERMMEKWEKEDIRCIREDFEFWSKIISDNLQIHTNSMTELLKNMMIPSSVVDTGNADELKELFEAINNTKSAIDSAEKSIELMINQLEDLYANESIGNGEEPKV